MDIESLKLVLDALKGLSDGTSTAVTWWIVAHYGTRVLGFLIVGSVIVVAAVLVARAVAHVWHAAALCSELALITGVEGFDCWFGPDRHRLKDRIISLIEASRKQQV